MSQRKYLSISILIVFLLGSTIVKEKTNWWPFSSSSLSSPKSCNAAQLKTSIPFVSITDWQQFRDTDLQITMDYPVEWKVEPTIQQMPPFSDPEAIIKRLSFLGPEGGIDLDIWLSNGQNLQDWLAWYIKSRDALPITRPNAVINGLPAVVFIQNGGVDMLTAFFSDTQYTYRLWYSVTRNGRGLQAFWHILDTFALSRGTKSIAQIPDNVRQSAQLAISESVLLSGSNCCGHYSGYCSVYFPCCSDTGNCVWWVCYQYGAVPFRGDAGTWWGQVSNYPDWMRSAGPRVGQENIAWWSSSSVPPYGHVAYAPNYSSGNIYINEMYWCSSCYHEQTISTSSANGYIFERYPPQH